ncbi:DUF3021 family protein [Christensenella hongkongensis]|uniref:DUF3021 family protein n=1 Tax=Christensenella hongkongensis TaxID=270498 RepID=UPI002672C697|nr:DUF3021 family protein [Christensenella hongkongensis]
MVQEWFKNFFSTTAVTIFLIILAGIITGDDSVKMISLISAIVANLIIHLGLIGIRKISSVYYLLEMLLEFAYVLGVVLLTGFLSGWFLTTPVWVTLIITVVVFVAACLIDIVHINKDIEDINKQIAQRNG